MVTAAETHTSEQSDHLIPVQSGTLAMLCQPVVYYGAAIGRLLPTLTGQANVRRVLAVTTPSVARQPGFAAIAASLPGGLSPFTGTKPHTPFDSVCSLARQIVDTAPDLLVVIGGGSAIDTVKVATMAAAAGTLDLDGLLGLRMVPGSGGEMMSATVRRAMPVIAVPTTLSAAEFGVIAGATDTRTGVKHMFKSDTLAPDVIVFDPALGLLTPLELWLSTGVRSLDHGIETVLSRDANPYTDALALRGIALLREGLGEAKRDPEAIRARHLCQLGVWLAACGIGRVRYGASHGLGHQLGAVAGVPHGITSCVLLPAVLAYNESVCAGEQDLIAAALGQPGRRASDVLRELVASLGLPTRIAELGLERSALRRVAETSLGNAFVKSNRRPVATQLDALCILESAY